MSTSTVQLFARSFRAQWARKECLATSRIGLQLRSQFHTSSPFGNIFLPHLNVRPTQSLRSSTLLFSAVSVAGIGLGLAKNIPQVHCDAPPEATQSPAPEPNPCDTPPPPPQSSVSRYQLSFGTVAGICTGIFLKKGAKAAAWFLGGIFVLLQYLASTSVVRVDWGTVATRFEDAFYSTDVDDAKRAPPTVLLLWGWLVDFLTADFQPRASFIAGLVLGLRIG